MAYSAVKAREHLSLDPRLREIMQQTSLPRRRRDQDVYRALVRTIVFQQLSGKAAETIHGRFLALFPSGYPKPEVLVTMETQDLRDVGLSARKATYVQEVARFWQDEGYADRAWHRLEDEEIIQQLSAIKGVGRWSAEMILMFTMRRPDVFPLGDLGIQQAVRRAYRLRTRGRALEQRMLKVARPWRPFRTEACFYLWRWYDQLSP